MSSIIKSTNIIYDFNYLSYLYRSFSQIFISTKHTSKGVGMLSLARTGLGKSVLFILN